MGFICSAEENKDWVSKQESIIYDGSCLNTFWIHMHLQFKQSIYINDQENIIVVDCIL